MESQININITLDEDKMPANIEWQAPGGGVDDFQKAKGLLLGLWDGEEKSALRIDLWTKKMMVDEMNDFFYQSLMGMADTYLRATRNQDLSDNLKAYAQTFIKMANEALSKEAE